MLFEVIFVLILIHGKRIFTYKFSRNHRLNLLLVYKVDINCFLQTIFEHNFYESNVRNF